MSGIFGIWHMDGRPLDPTALAKMAESMQHRGPDGIETWSRLSLGLGHCTMYSTPESLEERQPLVGADPEIVVTADMRLDNRDELISILGFGRDSQPTIADADLLRMAYLRWGERCAEHVLGDFAFAIWDPQRRELLCVRDHFGVRPLYYFSVPGMFAFASEIEALLSLPEVPDDPDELEVARHLSLPIGADKRATYHRHVRRLLPAHLLRVSDQALEERGYWRLDETRELHLASDDEYADAFRALFEDAVRHRLRSTTPIGSMLSGGLDSAAITCVAARILGKGGPLHTLSAVYPSVPESDERGFIDEVLERHDVKPHFFNAETVNPYRSIDSMNRFIGGASYGGNLYLNWELYGIASRQGIRVVLDGFDGDSTVSHGWTYLTELAATGRWLKLASFTFPYSKKEGRAPIPDYLSTVRFGLRQRFRETAAANLLRRVRRRGHDPNEQQPLLSWDPIVEDTFASQFSDRVAPAEKPYIREREFHARKLNSPSLMEVLAWIEACGAGQGVEVRFPFFDVKLVELCLSLPPDQKIRRGWTRYVMRRAMEGVLPPEIQWRPTKAGMRAGFEFAFRANGDDRIDAVLANGNHTIARYVNIDRLRELYGRFMRGETARHEARILERALTLALWLEGQSERSRAR
jgi:asparagine synthase (glutamine-hydrolysing)